MSVLGQDLTPVHISDVFAAEQRLRKVFPPSPLLSMAALDNKLGVPVYLKADCLLPSGAYKFRGATNKITALVEKLGKDIKIITASSGNHGMAFATNFNPEINIREVTQKGRYYENGKWVVTEPHEIHKPLNYPEIGERESYVIYHEELESLVKNYPTIKRARFWMTFGQEYLTHLRVIQNIGMARIDPIMYNGVEIVPIQFLKAVLPDPKSLGANYHGQTSIGCRIKGIKDGKERTAFKETGTQAVSFTTGVPAALGAAMWAKGLWRGAGVFNVEEFDPDPFLAELGEQGLPWHELFDVNLEV